MTAKSSLSTSGSNVLRRIDIVAPAAVKEALQSRINVQPGEEITEARLADIESAARAVDEHLRVMTRRGPDGLSLIVVLGPEAIVAGVPVAGYVGGNAGVIGGIVGGVVSGVPSNDPNLPKTDSRSAATYSRRSWSTRCNRFILRSPSRHGFRERSGSRLYWRRTVR